MNANFDFLTPHFKLIISIAITFFGLMFCAYSIIAQYQGIEYGWAAIAGVPLLTFGAIKMHQCITEEPYDDSED